MVASERVVIQKVQAKDLPMVIEVERLSFGSPFPPSYIHTLAVLSPETFLTAKVDGRVVGYVVSTIRGRVAHVLSLAVHPRFRRRRVGETLLLKTFEAMTGKVSSIELEVRKSNAAAQRLYEKAGFKASSTVKAYYNDGEDAVVMKHILAEKHSVVERSL